MYESKLGQLCWKNKEKTALGIITSAWKDRYKFKDEDCLHPNYEYNPLTKQEIQQFMEKANEPTRL